MSKRSMQNKLALLQQKWEDGVDPTVTNDLESGDWSQDNIAKNRAAVNKEMNPWVSYGMTCSEWYEKIIKPKMEAKAA